MLWDIPEWLLSMREIMWALSTQSRVLLFVFLAIVIESQELCFGLLSLTCIVPS